MNISAYIPTKVLNDYALTLKMISKRAYPTAIRQTLNSAAFDVKKVSMPKSSDRFVKRSQTFFKASSTVIMASGNNVSTMQSTVGFKPKNDKKAHSIEDLEQQEHGGKIKDRDLIAGRQARGSGSWHKNVKTGLRLKDLQSKIKYANLIDTSKGKRTLSKKQKFIRASFIAQKTGKFVLGNKKGTGTRTISRIDSAVKVGGKIRIKRTALYSWSRGRAVTIKPTNFMKRASMETALSINKWFIINAEKQINSVYK